MGAPSLFPQLAAGGEADGDVLVVSANRRRAPRAGAAAAVRICALGDMVVETAGGVIERAWLSQRAGRLLRYLVCQQGRSAPADEIVEALWPGASAGADENVRYLVHLLRRRLEPDRPSRARSLSVECLGGQYALGSSVWVDVRAFEELVDDGFRSLRAGQEKTALSRLGWALDLYRGDFLADEPYADWAMMERERLRAVAEDALRVATALCEMRRELGRALDYARWLAGMARYDSDVQLRLISLCLRCGRRSEAARRYASFRAHLLREFGEEPEFDLPAAASMCSDVQPLDLASIPTRSSRHSVGRR